MCTNDDTETQVVHANDLPHSAVLCVVQLETSVLGGNLKSEAAELPEGIQGVFVDCLRVEKKSVSRIFQLLNQLTAFKSFFIGSLTSAKNLLTGSTKLAM